MREFITGILRDMEGNALLSLASGKTEPTEAAPNGKLKVERHFWFAYPAELDLMVEFAEKAHANREDAYLSPLIYGDAPFIDKKQNVIRATRDGRPLFTRSLANALFSQTVYMDSDECPPEAFRIPPSRHVQTSEGHGHDYWFLASPVPAAVAAEVAHRITTAHKAEGSDPSGWSANKVLRLPTFNTSYDEFSPFEVTWGDSDAAAAGEVYDVTDISGAYDDIEVAQTAAFGDVALSPVPKVEGLPPFLDLVARIPEREKRLNDLIYKNPKLGPGGWRTEQRFALLLDLRRFGFSDEETISIAWHSPAAAKWREDARGIDGLWWELQVKVNPIILQESGKTISAAPPVEPDREGPKLLSGEERARIARRSDVHSLYLAWARSKVPSFNAPYHHINGWLMLSVTLGDCAVFPKDPKPLPLGLYSITVGGSSTGKTEAEQPLNDVLEAFYPVNPPHQAGRSSKEALIEALIERDGKVTYITEDEGDGLLLEVAGGGPMAGMPQIWTKIYDGDVPALGRVGRKELNVVGRKTVPTFRLMGTPEGILKAVNKGMFYTGFLARVIWILGEETPITEEGVRTKLRKGRTAVDPMPKWWASHLRNMRARVLQSAPLESTRAELWPTDEALARLDKAKWQITQHFAREHDAELWKTIVRRMGDIMWKIAGLSAVSDGRSMIGLRDVEVAIAYAESWLANVVEIASRVSDTFFSKQCDEIEKLIAGSKEQTADIGSIYRFRKAEPKRIVDDYIQSLVFQGRIEEAPTGYYKIKRGTR